MRRQGSFSIKLIPLYINHQIKIIYK